MKWMLLISSLLPSVLEMVTKIVSEIVLTKNNNRPNP